MRTYFYRRIDGTVIHMEAEQMFWSGTACVFVKRGLTVAVISLQIGEIICEQESIGEVVPRTEIEAGAKVN